MNVDLTDTQRKFLIYLKDNHSYVGMYSTIQPALKDNEYEPKSLYRVVDNFKRLVHEMNTGENTHQYCTIERYGKPTKYLKG